MNERLEDAIRGVIYWEKAYIHAREKFNETGEEKYAQKMDINRLHILTKAKWLEIVYREETGKEVTTVGNLPEVHILNEML